MNTIKTSKGRNMDIVHMVVEFNELYIASSSSSSSSSSVNRRTLEYFFLFDNRFVIHGMKSVCLRRHYTRLRSSSAQQTNLSEKLRYRRHFRSRSII